MIEIKIKLNRLYIGVKYIETNKRDYSKSNTIINSKQNIFKKKNN